MDGAQTHHPPTRLGVEEQLLQTGNHGYGGALVCGGYCVALCHRDSWSFSGSDSGLQL